MGRTSKRHNRIIIPTLFGMACLSHETMAGSWVKSVRTAQDSLPILTLETELARDADTYADDKTLVSTCTAKGQPPETCLCVTHVLKYELTLNEYRAAIELYEGPQSGEALSATLKDKGITPEDIRMAQDVLKGLAEAVDFEERCEEARAYYRPKGRRNRH